MDAKLRKLATHPGLVLGTALLLGAVEFLALQRSAQRQRKAVG